MNILYIDDDPAEHKFLEYFLKSNKHDDVELCCVDSMEVALETLQSSAPDIVFLDDRFRPYISALETLPVLRPVLGSAKIAVISSSLEASHLKSASMLGVDKIFDKAELKSLLSGNIMDIF